VDGVKRGDVHEYAVGSRVVRAVIVSANQYARWRIAMAPIADLDPRGQSFGLAVATTLEDPVTGSIDVGRIRPADQDHIRARVGTLTPATMRKVSAALKDFLDLE
jgi:mRNA-degrading endonuclease toxin of MazEF toxin-antitoxin module